MGRKVVSAGQLFGLPGTRGWAVQREACLGQGSYVCKPSLLSHAFNLRFLSTGVLSSWPKLSTKEKTLSVEGRESLCTQAAKD